MRIRSGFFIFFVFGMELKVFAHPVPYKGATAVTTLNQPFQSNTSLAYSFARSAALGARIMTFKSGNTQMDFYGSQLNILAHRSNEEHYQSNIYASTAVGSMTYNKHTHSSVLTGIEADIESRKLYASGKAEKMWVGAGKEFWHAQSRLGFAPYAAGFKQLGSWLMLQYEYNPVLKDYSKVTPFIRLYFKNYLAEAGASLDGDVMLNFMVHL